MEREKIVLELGREIARLEQVRDLLAGKVGSSKLTVKRKPGRPTGSAKQTLRARKKIAAAMKKSWAERKKRAAALAKK